MIVSEEKISYLKGYFTEIVEILGKDVFTKKIHSSFDYIAISSEGLSAKIIQNFKYNFNLTKADLAYFLNISEPTIYRWLKENKTLDRNTSVQIFELTDLFLFGIKVFENKKNFFKWLELENIALGGKEPKYFLGIPEGISKVRELLGRIEYGVYS